MAVRIPISADAGEAAAAIEQIRSAIRRAQQEGRAFADINFAHPELRGMADDIQRVVRQMEDVERLQRGSTAATVRRVSGGPGVGGWEAWNTWWDNGRRAFGTDAEWQQHQDSVNRYILQGTRWALPDAGGGTLPPPSAPGLPPTPVPAPPPRVPLLPPLPGAPGGPGGPGAPGEGGGGGSAIPGMSMLGGAWRMASPIVGFTAAAMGIQKLTSVFMGGINDATKESVENDSLLRMLRGAASDFDSLRQGVRDTADALRVTDLEAQSLAKTWQSLTTASTERWASGGQGMGNALRDVQFAGRFALGYGLAPGTMVAGLGQASFMGQDPKAFALMLADVVHDSRMNGRMEEVMQAMLRWTEISSRQLVTGNTTAEWAGMYAAMNQTGQPGFRGAGAEAVLSQVDNTIRQGGGAGEAGRALIYQAFAKRGITDPYEVQYHLEEGAFGKVGGQTILQMLQQEFEGGYGGVPKYMRLNAYRNMFGVNMHQADVLSKLAPTDVTALQKILSASGVDINSMNAAGIADLTTILGKGDGSGGWRDMEAVKKRALQRTDLTPDERDRISTAGDDATLTKAVVEIISSRGMNETQGSKAHQESVRLQNETTRAMTVVAEAATGLKGILNNMLGPVSEIASELKLRRVGQEGSHGGGRDAFGLNETAYIPDQESGFNPNYVVRASLGVGSNSPPGPGSNRGIRNNNPMNLKWAQSQGVPSDTPGNPGAGFGVYPSVEAGVSSGLRQFLTYQDRYGARTIRQMIERWAPRSDGNDTESYIQRVARHMGMSPDDVPNLRDPQVAQRWVEAISREEVGRAPSRDQTRRGVDRALGARHETPAAAHVPAGAQFRIAPLEISLRYPDGTTEILPQLPVSGFDAPLPWGI